MDDLFFYDTCVRIGRSRAPDPPGNVSGVDGLVSTMQRHHIAHAAVEHAVAMESSPSLGRRLLEEEIAGHEDLRPAWHLMPDISPRIEKAVTDPDDIIRSRVVLGRVDAKDFCEGKGDRACFAPVLDACAAVHLPVFLDFRRQGNILTFDFDICVRYPGIPFVIEGVGAYPLHRIVWCLKQYENLYLSIVNFRAFNGVAFLCDQVGAAKLIFGSDWPAASTGLSLGMVLFANVSDEDRHKIARGNFERLTGKIGT